MKTIIQVSIFCFLFSFFRLPANGQVVKYLFERLPDESPSEFVDRHLPDYADQSSKAHQVIEGYWGDESKGKKIMAFYNDPMIEEYDRATMVVFQPVGDGKHYILIISNEIGTPGTYYEGVESVFFLDVDDDGFKELFVLEKGASRVPVIMEEEDDAGNVKEIHTSACCEDDYNTVIFEQIQDGYGGFYPLVKLIGITECDLGGLDTAIRVKEKVFECLKN